MYIETENTMKRKTHSCMILADTKEGKALAVEVGARLSAYSIDCTLDTSPADRIPWAGVDYSKAQYPDYKRISDADPEYILVLSMKNGYNPIVRALPYYAKDTNKDKERDTENSRRACMDMYQALKGVGCAAGPSVGTKVIPWKDVEDFPNLREGNQVFINLKMDIPVGYESIIAEAIFRGVAAYFGR